MHQLTIVERPAAEDDRRTASGAPMPPAPAWRWTCICGRAGGWRNRRDHAVRGHTLHVTKATR